ncbi:superoxide dismutase [Haematococcus lacustris]|uniref:Superoxide dismutase n=1 Tax=Haematococcus lacustris TaxID=44745 RepID=A0A699Z1A3_HAELA|nr:superoxide dismutase [Haematococcus lacustris]
MNAIELKAPPYPLDALEPHMSKSTFEYHWGKHHKTYVDNLNKQIAGKDWENKELEEIVLASWNNGSPTPEFNNAAQIWNHTFFWESMKPNGGGAPTGALAEAINRDFGSFDEFKNQFKQAGLTQAMLLPLLQFGSGWAWLNSDKSGKLSISKTPNAVLPVVEGKSPILTCDVWEHAYYIDYQNRRPDFIQTFMDKLINWDMVSQRYAAAQQ